MAKNTLLSTEKPTLRINADELPQIKDWKIDGEYTLTLKVRMTGISKPDYETNSKVWGSFRVEDVKSDDKDDLAKGMDSIKPQYVRK